MLDSPRLLAKTFLQPFLDFAKDHRLSSPSKATIKLTHCFRDFVQGLPDDTVNDDWLSLCLDYSALSPVITAMEFGSLLAPPDPDKAASPLQQLRQRMAYTVPLFDSFLNKLSERRASALTCLTSKTYYLLVPDQAAAEQFVSLYRRAQLVGISVKPYLFVSACPHYSQINKRRSVSEDMAAGIALATYFLKTLNLLPILCISGFNGVYADKPDPLQTYIEHTMMLTQAIPHEGLVLGDTHGLATPSGLKQLLAHLHDAAYPFSDIHCHFHYNDGLDHDAAMVRLTTLILTALILGLSQFDLNLFEGGRKNPLSGRSTPETLSSNLLFSHFLAICTAFNIQVSGHDGDAVQALGHLFSAQAKLSLPTEASVPFKIAHLVQAFEETMADIQ